MSVPKIALDGSVSLAQPIGLAFASQEGALGIVSPRPARNRSVAAEETARPHRSPSPSGIPNAYGVRSLSRADGSRGSSSSSQHSDPLARMVYCGSVVGGQPLQNSPATVISSTPIQRELAPSTPAADVTTICADSNGQYVAYGDRRGDIYILKVEPAAQSRRSFTLLPFARRSAYSPVIDPLTSNEISPKINKICFLPSVGPTPFVLTINEKVPKLWKAVASRQSPPVFRAVDRIGTKMVGPLTLDERSAEPVVLIKQAARFAMDHEFVVNSVCAMPDGHSFLTADDLVVRLWDVSHASVSIELFSIKPADGGEVHESFSSVAVFHHEPSLVLMTTTAGNVRVMDVRQSLRWHTQPSQVLSNPARAEDGQFSGVTCSLSSCALSPCSRYIAARDFMSVALWDVRMMGSPTSGPPSPVSELKMAPLRRWELHPHLADHYENLYQTELLFERFDLVFSDCGNFVFTGSTGGNLGVININCPEDVQMLHVAPRNGNDRTVELLPRSAQGKSSPQTVPNPEDHSPRIMFLSVVPQLQSKGTRLVLATQDMLHGLQEG